MTEPQKDPEPEQEGEEEKTSPTRAYVIPRQKREQFRKGDKVWMDKPNDDRHHAMTVEKARMLPGTNQMEYVLKDSEGRSHPDIPQSWVKKR